MLVDGRVEYVPRRVVIIVVWAEEPAAEARFEPFHRRVRNGEFLYAQLFHEPFQAVNVP